MHSIDKYREADYGQELLIPLGVGIETIEKFVIGALVTDNDLTVGAPGISDLKLKTVGVAPPLGSLYLGPYPDTWKNP